jgi:hypothetical protein
VLKSAQNAILFLQANRNLWIPPDELSVSARNMKNFRTNKPPIHRYGSALITLGDGPFIFDGFVKSPTSALCCIPQSFNVRKVRLMIAKFARLEFELFTKPSTSDFLRVHHFWASLFLMERSE